MEYKPYLPILKWRLGEYQALSRLHPSIKSSIYPLFVVPPIEYDFETSSPKKTAEEHIKPLVKRLEEKWGEGPASIELHETLHSELMDSGVSVPEHVFNKLLSSSTNIQPVLRLNFDSTYISNLIGYCKNKKCGTTIRIKFEDLADSDLMNGLEDLIHDNKLDRAKIDLVIDFDSKCEYIPYTRIETLTNMLISNIGSFNTYRSIYLAGTTLDFSSVSKDTLVTQPREYWKFYKRFYIENCDSIPNLGYGDFAIEPPEFAPSLDMRVIKPAARIIYSIDEYWAISKGSAFRDNPAQMYDMCHDFVYKSGYYMSKSLSNGDMKIYECANKKCSNGSLTTWKEAGTSHHISFVVQQLATFHD